jgi:hypothetical protein
VIFRDHRTVFPGRRELSDLHEHRSRACRLRASSADDSGAVDFVRSNHPQLTRNTGTATTPFNRVPGDLQQTCVSQCDALRWTETVDHLLSARSQYSVAQRRALYYANMICCWSFPLHLADNLQTALPSASRIKYLPLAPASTSELSN